MDDQKPPELSVRDLISRAQAGDESTLPRLRALIAKPHVLDAIGGHLMRDTETALIAGFRPKDLYFAEPLKLRIEQLRAELNVGSGSAIERLLVDRTVLCWLQLHLLELGSANRTNLIPAQQLLFDRKISASSKRFLAAIKTLATVRRLAVPVLVARIEIAGRDTHRVAASDDRPKIVEASGC